MANLTVLWTFQDGTRNSDELSGGAVGSDGNLVLVGETWGDWNGANFGDWSAVALKMDRQGDVIWNWTSGTLRAEGVRGMASTDDEAIIVVGYRDDNDDDFFATKISADGKTLWDWENGTTEDDEVEALAVFDDGSTIAAGWTRGSWETPNLGERDFAATKLDVDGNVSWKWQNGTELDDCFLTAAAAENGSVILAGMSSGNWSGLNVGAEDFAAIKIDSDGRELWRWQDGTTNDDVIQSVATRNDGSVLLAGYTWGGWDGENAGDKDFAACQLDADGTEIWRWQGGTNTADDWRAVFAGENDSVVLIGNTKGVWDEKNFGGNDFAAAKLDANGAVLWRWQNGSDGDDWSGRCRAVRGTDSQILVAGRTDGKWATLNAGKYDFAALLIDVGPLESASSPTPVQSQPPAITISPSLAPTNQTLGPLPSATPTHTPSTETPSASRTSSSNLEGDKHPHPAQIPSATTTPTPFSGTPFPSPALAATMTPDERPSSTALVVASTFGVILLLALMVAGWRYCRKSRRLGIWPHSVGNPAFLGNDTVSHACPPRGQKWPSRERDLLQSEAGCASTPWQGKAISTDATKGTSSDKMPDTVEKAESSHDEHKSSFAARTKGGEEHSPLDNGEGVHDATGSSMRRFSRIDSCRRPPRGIGVAQAVIGLANDLAKVSQVPGVAEVAGLVDVLMKLKADSSNFIEGDYTEKRCRAVLLLSQRAAGVLNEADKIKEPAHRLLVEDVRDAVGELEEIIKSYRSKGRLSQVVMSTLFKRRQDEAEAVIDAAVSRLQFGLHIQVGNKMDTLVQDVKEGLRLKPHGSEAPEQDSSATNILEARRIRRQINLDMVEIPDHFVTVTDELLGKGGFGSVYMADYNGRNAAAKVVKIEHDLGRPNNRTEETTYGMGPLESKPSEHDTRRKAFWRELETMRRLRSPHTVHLYGAITSRDDRLVLVMELLPGGDLRTLLKGALKPLEESHARQIVGDVCAGMAFLHQKKTIHGDLKSPNVLFDGTGRAKIGDFGTSKWPQLANSTGLATYTTASSESTQMSYAWAAPEVLDTNGTSYASDIYSFGVVVWEVLSRKMPWAEECRRNIYVRVVIKEQRPEIPVDSPPDLANIVNACWNCVPSSRPAFSDIMDSTTWV